MTECTAADQIALQIAEVVQTLAMHVAYDEEGYARKFSNPNLDSANRYLGLFLHPDEHQRVQGDPEQADVGENLAFIATALGAAVSAMKADLNGMSLNTWYLLTPVLQQASDLATRLLSAYRGLPGSFEELEKLATIRGQRQVEKPSVPFVEHECGGYSSRALTALDLLDQIGDTGTHWWSLIDRVLETQRSEKGLAQPMPEWALQILKDGGRHSATEEAYRHQRESLAEVIALENNQPATFAFEVWGDRTTRLSVGHESLAQAMPAQEHWRTNGHPNAHILKFRRRASAASRAAAHSEERVHVQGAAR